MTELDIFMAGFEAEVSSYGGLSEFEVLLKLAEAAGDEGGEGAFPRSLSDALASAAERGSLAAAAGLYVLSLVDPDVGPKAKAALLAVARRLPGVREGLVSEGLTVLVEEECERRGWVRETDEAGRILYRDPNAGRRSS